MTPKKPEWIQIAEGDQSTSAVRKVDKKLTFGAILGAGLIVLTGSLFANAKNEPVALANPTVNSSTVSASTSAAPAVKSAPVVPAPRKSTIKAPSIAQPPMGQGDDREGEEREDD
jgi:hypothetical protein